MKNRNLLILSAYFVLVLNILLFFSVSLFAQEADEPGDFSSGVPARVSVKEYDASDSRDPFKSPFSKSEEVPEAGTQEVDRRPPSLVVEGVVWGGKFPQAIVNKQVVKIGDVIEGAMITQISAEGVTVTREGRKYTFSAPAASEINSTAQVEGGER